MLDVRKLRLLTELDRLGTLAAVAAELHQTAPGVSMQLTAWERELGMQLTERRGRRLALTPAGRMLAAHGRDVLDRLSLAELEIDAVRSGASGALRVTAFPSAARTFVADAWATLLSEPSGIALTVTTAEPDDALAALAAGDTDLALVHRYSNVARRLPDSLSDEPVLDEPVWIAIRSDDPVAASTIALADLADHAWIAPTPELSCFEMVDRACGLEGFRPRIVAESVDFAAQLAFVAAGAGVALVPELTVASLPDGVTLARPARPIRRTTIAVRRTARKDDPALDRITALLRRFAAGRLH
ncbi:LysR family transcriptional regulator [Protaetiibacter mangrovi]|uniref:LysR family transcriptional regulator n=1 Tax=Protaetiibacter mangrovi TaxID=2970926 RepID=A0ABT1ZHT7_9MICO|nr:LysR family transcriptional regulator [Protaetiibacter mangrovi]MCS0500255.1 LysR family transcriptional regulator [Protaetiibacter mangrovi]TPW94787.1 LysR family transcriptional regulator [Schumannella luteola]